MQDEFCIKCQKPLTKDEIGLHKKLFNRAATEYMCINCISSYIEVPTDILENKITEFKNAGCTLFK